MSEQTNTNNEPKKVSLFREKSLEAIESPESLNDYLKVTSPGVWLVLAAVVVLLAGAILWGIFGHIRTTAQVAVKAEGGKVVCYVPYTQAEGILKQGVVKLDGREYLLDTEGDLNVEIIPEDASVTLRKAGDLSAGDPVVLVPVDASLEDGVYSGVAVTEDLHPISLLLQ